jgi:cytochrome b561|tara:strand:- start:140 stop:376 length:237 start_codon:yes stop_codon:yes gene_type:complete
MEYKDEKGKEYEISYSQKLQEKVVRELKRSQQLQRKNAKLFMVIIVLFALVILGIGIALLYLDQRDAITIIGKKVFCS